MMCSIHFYFRLSGIGRREFDRSNRKPAAVITWATLSDQQQGFFYMHQPTDRIVHTYVMENWLE